MLRDLNMFRFINVYIFKYPYLKMSRYLNDITNCAIGIQLLTITYHCLPLIVIACKCEFINWHDLQPCFDARDASLKSRAELKMNKVDFWWTFQLYHIIITHWATAK